jgi:hypothetical protein
MITFTLVLVIVVSAFSLLGLSKSFHFILTIEPIFCTGASFASPCLAIFLGFQKAANGMFVLLCLGVVALTTIELIIGLIVSLSFLPHDHHHHVLLVSLSSTQRVNPGLEGLY